MRYLTVEEIMLIHEYELRQHGGVDGVLNIMLLESATFRPQTVFNGKELYATVFDKAACLVHSVIKNHAFTDGNKRTAMVSCATFLYLNNFKLNLTQSEFVDIALKIANDALSLSELSTMLKNMTTAV